MGADPGECHGRAEQGQADIPEKVLIIYPERQGAAMEPIFKAAADLYPRHHAASSGFYSLLQDMGLHIISLVRN